MLKKYFVLSVLFFSGISFADQDVIKEIKSGKISIKTISMLNSLDQKNLKIGYGLCTMAGNSSCEIDGSLGYGLCMESGNVACEKNGSLGYGICRVSGNIACEKDGSLGYGLCKASGNVACKK